MLWILDSKQMLWIDNKCCGQAIKLCTVNKSCGQATNALDREKNAMEWTGNKCYGQVTNAIDRQQMLWTGNKRY